MKPFFICARTPASFEGMVSSALKSGYGFEQEPFVLGELLCQWVKPMANYYEYKLVVGASLIDLQAEAQKYWSDGFEVYSNPLSFYGCLVLWVRKWKEVRLHQNEEQALVEGVVREMKYVESSTSVMLTPILNNRFSGMVAVEVLSSYAQE